MGNKVKILIAIPSNGLISVETARDLITMLASGDGSVVFDVYTPMGCYIHLNREISAARALELGADYLFFIDSDMTFSRDSLTKLLALNADIAAAHYNIRGVAPRCSVLKLTEELASKIEVPEGVTERPIPFEKILQPFEVSGAGTGFMLIKTNVFRNLPKPWFFFKPGNDSESHVGEDIWFCELAREHGHKILVDPTIRVGHIGSVIF